MQGKRWIQHWYVWVLVDVVYVPMYVLNRNFITAVLYLVAFAFLGLLIGCLATHVVVKSVTDTLNRELAEREASKSSAATADGR